MIFLTVGHQTPFDRLVKVVDEWSRKHSDVEVFAQIGNGRYTPGSFPYERWLTSERFVEIISAATAVISHAGTGTILQAVIRNKPLLVLPRQARLKETRNDHQIGTARYFAQENYLLAIEHESEIDNGMERLRNWTPAIQITEFASNELTNGLRKFIQE